MSGLGRAAALPAPLAAALAAFPAGLVLLQDAPAVALIKAGATNDTWRVTTPGTDWVVRIGVGEDARLAVDRAREAGLLERLASAGLCPSLVCVMPERGLLVTHYVAATPLEARNVRDPAFLRRLGSRLRQLHSLPVPAGAVGLDLHALFVHYLGIAAPQHAPVPRAQLSALLRRELPAYAPLPLALCHHDLHRDNVLAATPLCFVDWEYAAFSDPLLDLATFAAYEELGAAAEAALLEGYGPATGLEPVSLRRGRLLADCLRALWLDAADAWDGLGAAARDALCARLLAQPPREV